MSSLNMPISYALECKGLELTHLLCVPSNDVKFSPLRSAGRGGSCNRWNPNYLAECKS